MSVFPNYHPDNIVHPDPVNLAGNKLWSGAGGPPNTLGVNGDVYVNISTGDIYTKENNVWAIQSGGGGSGVQQIFQGDADPVAPPTDPSKPAILYNHTTAYGWRWDTTDQAWS